MKLMAAYEKARFSIMFREGDIKLTSNLIAYMYIEIASTPLEVLVGTLSKGK